MRAPSSGRLKAFFGSFDFLKLVSELFYGLLLLLKFEEIFE